LPYSRYGSCSRNSWSLHVDGLLAFVTTVIEGLDRVHGHLSKHQYIYIGILDGRHSSNAVDLYLGGTELKSWPGYCLYWLRLFLVFHSRCRQMLA
jgi:hypothetical protein